MGIEDLFQLPPWQILAVLYGVFTENKPEKARKELNDFLASFNDQVWGEESVREVRSLASRMRDEERELFGDSYDAVMQGEEL